MNGIECVERLTAEIPNMQILMLTVYEDTDQIFKALAAGASGYLLKRSSPAKLLQAIREVHEGGSPMSSSIARKVVASFQKSKQPDEKQSHLSAPRGNGFEVSGPRADLQTDCRPIGNKHRYHPHLSSARLRKIARPVAHRGGRQVSEPLIFRGQGSCPGYSWALDHSCVSRAGLLMDASDCTEPTGVEGEVVSVTPGVKTPQNCPQVSALANEGAA